MLKVWKKGKTIRQTVLTNCFAELIVEPCTPIVGHLTVISRLSGGDSYINLTNLYLGSGVVHTETLRIMSCEFCCTYTKNDIEHRLHVSVLNIEKLRMK